MRQTTGGGNGNADALHDMSLISKSSPDIDAMDFYCYCAPHGKKPTADCILTVAVDENVAVTPSTGRKVAFTSPLVTEVRDIPRLSREEVRQLFYSREDRQLFKRMFRMQKLIEEDAFLAGSAAITDGLNVISKHRCARDKSPEKTDDISSWL